MDVGKIRRVFHDKGYGYISPVEGGEDVRFETQQLTASGVTLADGMSVEYEAKRDFRTNKLCATKVNIPRSSRPAQRARDSNPSRDQTRYVQKVAVPPECIFDTFYVNGYKRREIFVEAADQMANIFCARDTKVSRSSIRRLFSILKAVEQQIGTGDPCPAAKVAEVFFKFHQLVVYNNNRKGPGGRPVLPDVFKDWVQKHLQVATSNPREFVGFVEYLVSIMARLSER